MKQTIIFFTLYLLHFVSFAQEGLVPQQYQSIKEIYGDLNKDSIDEKVVVYNMGR